MIDILIELVKRVLEKDEKSRKFAVTLADSYLRRISRFQDQLVLLGIALNFTAAGCMLAIRKDCLNGTVPFFGAAAMVFFVNMLLAKLYSNEHRTTKLLFARYPELELIMVGDKSWSNFKVLAKVFQYVQTGWLLCAAFLGYSLIRGN
ncbi:MAG: hypothetical protein WCW52_03850 [Elusimicrobiales bacterium]|jgi:hypothetical protein